MDKQLDNLFRAGSQILGEGGGVTKDGELDSNDRSRCEGFTTKANPLDSALGGDRRRLAAGMAKRKNFENTLMDCFKVMINTSAHTKEDDVMAVIEVSMDNDFTTMNKVKYLDVTYPKDFVQFAILFFRAGRF